MMVRNIELLLKCVLLNIGYKENISFCEVLLVFFTGFFVSLEEFISLL